MNPSRTNRRSFLQLAAAGTLAAGGLLAGLRPGAASRARAGGIPPRFLFLYTPAGWTPRGFFMRPSFSDPGWGHWSDILRAAGGEIRGTTPDPTEFEFDLGDPLLAQSEMSTLLAPHWDHRRQLTAIEGLAYLSTGWDSFGDAHAQNHLAVGTAGPAISEYDGIRSDAMYPSIDQLFLEHVRASGAGGGARSLNCRPNQYRTSGTDGYHYFLYGAGASGVSRVSTSGDPASLVDSELFADPSISDMEMEHQRAIRAQMFEQLLEQYGELGTRMGGSDRGRIEYHRGLLAQIRDRTVGPRSTCVAPPIGGVSGLSRGEALAQDFESFGDIITASFACGTSRVATLELNTFPEEYGLPPGTDIHHEYEHTTSARSFYPGPGNLVEEAAMIARNRLQQERLARLIARMDATPDADGGSLLDNTIVLYASEAGDGAHSHEWTPFMVFGGRNLGLTPGRYIKYAQDKPNPWGRNYYNEFTGTPHSQLYVSILRALGMDIDHFHGTSIAGSAPHVGVTATIDMSGPLARFGPA